MPAIAGLIHFVNVDLIAGGISPLQPELAAVTAGRLGLRELDRLVAARADFAFESTLSGLRYAKRMQDWKAEGYAIEIAYLRLPSPQLALSRVAARVKQGRVARDERRHRKWRLDLSETGWWSVEVMTSLVLTYCDDTSVAGPISLRFIALWQISGLSTIIPNHRQNCRNAAHDHSS